MSMDDLLDFLMDCRVIEERFASSRRESGSAERQPRGRQSHRVSSFGALGMGPDANMLDEI
jgi:hypothetical protein